MRINAEGGNLQSDKAVVSFRNNVISQATITGTPAEFEQSRKDGNTSRGRANTINYVTASGTVSLRENAWLSDGCNEITGPALVYNIKTQSVQGQSASRRTGRTGRVRIIIQPTDAIRQALRREKPGSESMSVLRAPTSPRVTNAAK